jgi:glycosyltransferase involved in cell wall biosynthesis
MLLLVGDGSVRPALQDRAQQLGIAGRVVFVGSTPHTRAMLCAMDVFAAPSEQETFGLAVLEALACGLPALYVTCPPLDELAAGPSPHARRLPPDPQAFRRALHTELTRLGERRSARLPVPPTVAHYDIAHLAQSVQRLYERVSSQRRQPFVSIQPTVGSEES